MQLKKRRGRSAVQPIGAPLAAATCALLGSSISDDVKAQELLPWDVDTSLLIYSEDNSRVQDLSFNVLARKELREEKFLSLTLALDTLTGASPNGAVPSTVPQTFTRPSGNASYVIAPQAQVLDDTFQDTRTALSASYEFPLARLTLLDVGASISDEYDYTHTGVNARLAHDFNNRNTTLSFGLAFASDTISPVGGAPVPLAPMLGVGDSTNKRGDDQSKDVTDFLLGVTQVLGRKTIVQLNYSLSQSDGYQTDPYKLLSVVDPVTGLPVAGPAGSGLFRYLYENRPDSREKQSIYGLIKRDFNGNVLEASYRYMTDDWGIDSHTVDVHYRWNLSSGYLQPHVRFYTQTDADFYHTVLFNGQPVPTFASADYRLGDFDGTTLGIKYGHATHGGNEWSARLEWYQQTGSADAASRVGVLNGLDLYPDMTALIAQVTYQFGRR